jgi:hypothetical protein
MPQVGRHCWAAIACECGWLELGEGQAPSAYTSCGQPLMGAARTCALCVLLYANGGVLRVTAASAVQQLARTHQDNHMLCLCLCPYGFCMRHTFRPRMNRSKLQAVLLQHTYVAGLSVLMDPRCRAPMQVKRCCLRFASRCNTDDAGWPVP